MTRPFTYTLWGADGKQTDLRNLDYADLIADDSYRPVIEYFTDHFTTVVAADESPHNIRLAVEGQPDFDIGWQPLTASSAAATVIRESGGQKFESLTLFLTGINRQAEDGPSIGAIEKVIAERLPTFVSEPFRPARWPMSMRPMSLGVYFSDGDWDLGSVNATICLVASYFRAKGVV
jgi:hypothetical protein